MEEDKVWCKNHLGYSGAWIPRHRMSLDKRRYDGTRSQCKDCYSKYRREIRKNSKDSREKESTRNKKYKTRLKDNLTSYRKKSVLYRIGIIVEMKYRSCSVLFENGSIVKARCIHDKVTAKRAKTFPVSDGDIVRVMTLFPTKKRKQSLSTARLAESFEINEVRPIMDAQLKYLSEKNNWTETDVYSSQRFLAKLLYLP